MKKKFLLIGATTALAGIAALSLGSCGGDEEKKVSAADNGSLDILLNYSGTGGISRVDTKTAFDPITDAQLTPGTLLPSWKAFASYTGTVLRDASNYSQTSDATVWENVAGGDTIMSQTDSSQNVDLIYNATGTFDGATAKLKSLNEFLGLNEQGEEDPTKEVVMPHFKAWLDKNKSYQKTLKKSGNYYYTPYFDGYNDIERMFIMDTSMTTKVLDSTSGWDESTTNGGSNASKNVVQGAFYTPFVNADYNYATAPTIKVLDGADVKDVTLVKTTNIIKQQNELLANGCTGKQLAQQLITYINTAAKPLFDDGIYTKVSDFYTSSAAAYNADDLVALMRVVKANPGLITGDSNVEIETFFPRAASNNRIENIYDLAQIWGIQGTDSEKGNFFVAGDGKFHALETTQASYDALTYLSQMYDEGLILKDFYTNSKSTLDKTGYLDILYKKTVSDNSCSNYGFMMYDYSAATCAANTILNGIGTKNSDRIEGFKNDDITGITAVLPPLTYWASESNWDHTQAITNFTGKSLTRYYEANRAIKTNSWAIPQNSDNARGAAIMMDFMFSDLGALIQDYGPTNYWASPEETSQQVERVKFDVNGDVTTGAEYMADGYVSTSLVAGQYNAIIHPYVKASLGNSGDDFWTYMRNYLGSTHGIGHVRSAGVNIQATNEYAQWGCLNVANAFATDTVLKLAQTDKFADLTWDSSVPTYGTTKKDTSYDWSAITGFWSADKGLNNTGWVNVVTQAWDAPKSSIAVKDSQKNIVNYQDVLDQFDNFNKIYLWAYADSVGSQYVPNYAKNQQA